MNIRVFLAFVLLTFCNSAISFEVFSSLSDPLGQDMLAIHFNFQPQQANFILYQIPQEQREITLDLNRVTDSLLPHYLVAHVTVVRSDPNQAITPDQVRILGQRFPNIRVLTLADVGLTTATTQELARHFPWLSILDITQNPELTHESAEVIQAALWFNSLTVLRTDSLQIFLPTSSDLWSLREQI